MRRSFAALSFCLLIAGLTAAPTLAAAQDVDLAYRQRTEERLAALERQLRDLTGQIERLQYRLNQANSRIDALEADLAAGAATTDPSTDATAPPQAFSQGEPGSPQPLAPAQPQSSSTRPAPGDGDRATGSLPTGDAQSEYDAAYGLLGQGKFASGEQAFRDFLKRYPDHQLAPNARYWIAETLYARQSYQDAAKAFLEAWQSDPRGAKAADNLLKLGMSLQRLDKKQEACASFAKLLSDYRGAADRIRSAASRERQSLGCS